MSRPLDSFAGKTALVTGAVSGLGFGIAKALAGEGVRLALGYRDEGDRETAARWFRDAGHDAPLFLPLDVADRAAWAAAREAVEREFGRLHILVNNAGISVFGPMDRATYADWDWILAVNLGGVINGLVTFLPMMEAHGETGHVVNVASMAAFLAGPQAGIYTTSKFAVRGLTESLRYTLAPTALGVSLMCPGLVDTRAYASALKRPDDFADSGLGTADPELLGQLAPVFAAGMSIEEAGQRLVAGMRRGDFWILSHGGYEAEFQEIHDELMAALPKEPQPPEREAVEEQRRAANRMALARQATGIGDMVVKDEA
ncbi:MAG: SDR family NAD(P)-dependent oxidoreductase [Sphingomonadaceae bacterium]|nr:SDR family NAD(P)-dependent oxidoreductase [Sphingomonadaceae bacterium]